MEKYVIERDSAKNLTFTGELLAKASSSDNNASGSSYSGSTGRWQVLALYRTEGGKLICERIDRTRWQGERDSHHAKVCTNNNEVIDFFGHGWLAKDLYEEAGIVACENVD